MLAVVLAAAHTSTGSCPRVRPLPTLRTRYDVGALLRQRGLSGPAAELGTQRGNYSARLLRTWRNCSLYVQVDAWAPLSNYEDKANKGEATQQLYKSMALAHLNRMEEAGFAERAMQCHNLTSVCATRFPPAFFDFIYVDARYDRLGVLEDLTAWWPLLRPGGVMAGHDYTEQQEPFLEQQEPFLVTQKGRPVKGASDPHSTGQNWTRNYDGTVDTTGRVVKGAVDDFFAGVAPPLGRPWIQQQMLQCPLQVVLTYRELGWNTWLVAKPEPEFSSSPALEDVDASHQAKIQRREASGKAAVGLCVVQYDDREARFQGQYAELVSLNRKACAADPRCVRYYSSYDEVYHDGKVVPSFWAKNFYVYEIMRKPHCSVSCQPAIPSHIRLLRDALPSPYQVPTFDIGSFLLPQSVLYMDTDAVIHQGLEFAQPLLSAHTVAMARDTDGMNNGVYLMSANATGDAIMRFWLSKYPAAQWSKDAKGVSHCVNPDMITRCKWVNKYYGQVSAPTEKLSEST